MYNNIDLDSLMVLDAVARNGSFEAAANELFRVRSAISYSIAKLEEKLKVTIFDRSGYRAKLTKIGAVVLEHGRALLEESYKLENKIQQINSGWEAELTIAFSTLISTTAIIELVNKFYKLKKITKITLLEEVYGGVWDALDSGRADLAIGASEQGPNKYKRVPIGELSQVFAIAPNHPLARKKDPLSIEQIQQYRTVVISDSSRFLPKKNASYLKNQDTISVPNLNAKIKAQLAGIGVGFMPESIARYYQTKSELIIKDVSDLNLSPEYSMIWESSNQGKAINWFISNIKKASWSKRLLRK